MENYSNMNNTPYMNKIKVIFILGATGTGKSKLSIDLAAHFPAEIINSDKIQVYRGLDIITNKVSEEEQLAVPHHLLGVIEDPDTDFSIDDFCHHVLAAIDLIVRKGRIPIIVGGSNTYIKALVEDKNIKFMTYFDPCFIWLDVALPVLEKRVRERVDEMVEKGVLDEIRGVFFPEVDYSKGIRRSIGVAELHEYFMAERRNEDDAVKKRLLEVAIEETKVNTINLACSQINKIQRLREDRFWPINQIDVTAVFEDGGEHVWKDLVLKKSIEIVIGEKEGVSA